MKRFFQGPGLPISNAVLSQPLPDSPPLPREYHPARKGQTTFFYGFQLPFTSPSSINFGNGVGKVQYEVSAQVEVFWKGEKRIVTDTKLVEVVECPPSELREMPPTSVVSDGGNIQIQGRIIGGFVVSSHTGCLELLVKNHSKRKVHLFQIMISRVFSHYVFIDTGSYCRVMSKATAITPSKASTSFHHLRHPCFRPIPGS